MRRPIFEEKLKSVLRLNTINPLNGQLNPICRLLELLGAHHILHISRIRVKNPSHHSTGLQDFNFINVVLQNFNAGTETVYSSVRNASNKTRCISRACCNPRYVLQRLRVCQRSRNGWTDQKVRSLSQQEQETHLLETSHAICVPCSLLSSG